jgi:outer membrane protein assembly factor BamE
VVGDYERVGYHNAHLQKVKVIMRLILIAIACLTLTGCGLFTPYKIQVQQGHIITNTMLKKVKPGMTRAQIKYVLGTPDLKDTFDHDTWYYVYTNEENREPMAKKELILHFKKDALASISGDYAPPVKLTHQ